MTFLSRFYDSTCFDEFNMLKMIKTTTLTTLAALTLAAGISTQANAQSANLISGATVVQSTQFNSTNRIQNRRSNNNDQLAGGAIGAVAGGLIGSQIAGNGSRTEGAVLGALFGGLTGAAIAGNNNRSRFNNNRFRSRGFSSRRGFNGGFGHSGFDSFGNSGFNSFGHAGFGSRGFTSRRGFGSSRFKKKSVLKRSF